jgi:hypothetical protein
MPNTTLTTSIIAKAAVTILENELGAAKNVFRGYEGEFSKNVNGYEPGDTISIRRPTDFTVRDGANAAIQDVVEGKTSIVVNKQKGIDFSFTSKELTLNISELSERVLRPAMIQLANQVDGDVLSLFSSVPNWVGTPGQVINSFSDFARGPELLDEYAVPNDGMRYAHLSPADNWGMVGNSTTLYMQDVAKGGYRKGNLGELAGVNTFMSQNVQTFRTGTRSGSPLINGTINASTTTYDAVKDTMTQSINIDTLGGATQTVKAGDVFTIAGVWAVNPVTKARLPFLKQFVVLADATATANAITGLQIYPAMIWTGAFKNIDADVANLDNQGVTFVGAPDANFRQNLVFHRNAFALVSVPLVLPPGAVEPARESYGGMSARLIPYYNGSNDVSSFRLDILYGVKAVDPRLATRASGTA